MGFSRPAPRSAPGGVVLLPCTCGKCAPTLAAVVASGLVVPAKTAVILLAGKPLLSHEELEALRRDLRA